MVLEGQRFGRHTDLPYSGQPFLRTSIALTPPMTSREPFQVADLARITRSLASRRSVSAQMAPNAASLQSTAKQLRDDIEDLPLGKRTPLEVATFGLRLQELLRQFCTGSLEDEFERQVGRAAISMLESFKERETKCKGTLKKLKSSAWMVSKSELATRFDEGAVISLSLLKSLLELSALATLDEVYPTLLACQESRQLQTERRPGVSPCPGWQPWEIDQVLAQWKEKATHNPLDDDANSGGDVDLDESSNDSLKRQNGAKIKLSKSEGNSIQKEYDDDDPMADHSSGFAVGDGAAAMPPTSNDFHDIDSSLEISRQARPSLRSPSVIEQFSVAADEPLNGRPSSPTSEPNRLGNNNGIYTHVDRTSEILSNSESMHTTRLSPSMPSSPTAAGAPQLVSDGPNNSQDGSSLHIDQMVSSKVLYPLLEILKSPKQFVLDHSYVNGDDPKQIYHRSPPRIPQGMDSILIPIIHNLHWTLAVINVQSGHLVYFDSLNIDFMPPNITQALLDVGRFLEKLGVIEGEAPASVSMIDCQQQENLIDCGIFLLCHAVQDNHGGKPTSVDVDVHLWRYLSLVLLDCDVDEDLIHNPGINDLPPHTNAGTAVNIAQHLHSLHSNLEFRLGSAQYTLEMFSLRQQQWKTETEALRADISTVDEEAAYFKKALDHQELTLGEMETQLIELDERMKAYLDTREQAIEAGQGRKSHVQGSIQRKGAFVVKLELHNVAASKEFLTKEREIARKSLRAWQAKKTPVMKKLAKCSQRVKSLDRAVDALMRIINAWEVEVALLYEELQKRIWVAERLGQEELETATRVLSKATQLKAAHVDKDTAADHDGGSSHTSSRVRSGRSVALPKKLARLSGSKTPDPASRVGESNVKDERASKRQKTGESP